ncbi:MAG: hypothetical protein EB078_02850 [Proteobacteria bacterium]|nr:hypothetical protein [Pseudomonadota bacterium]NDD03822.1 hypothetical protein [Pseudomonadota bacterium]NDG26076.1 hypothetical protein [Pseudomonadota bacterium]
MKRKFWIIGCVCLGLASSWGAQTKKDPLLEEEVSPPNRIAPPVELTGTFSVINPSRLVISSQEYQVAYSDNLLGFSAFQLGVGIPVSQWSNFQFSFFARAGYSRNRGVYALLSNEGKGSQSEITLHWIPLSGGIKTEYFIPDFDLIRPYLAISGGAEWLHQSGELPGVGGNFWIPFYNVALGLSFLDQPEADTWFGGFSFSMSFQNGLRRDQEAKTLSYDLTAHFFL